MQSKHLKGVTYYIYLYDRDTIERCRNLILIHAKTIGNPPLIKGRKPSKKLIEATSKISLDLMLMFEKGNRYLQKEETIRNWMAADDVKDKLYESAVPPADVRCPKCRNAMNLLDKGICAGGLNQPDRVLFMFDCPNGCLPRRAFYDNGEERIAKPHLCPKCGRSLDSVSRTTRTKFIMLRKCASCGFTETEELRHATNKKEKPDPDFEVDRVRFCLSKEEGEKWREELLSLKRMKELVDEGKERDKNKELYDRVAKIKKLTVVELSRLLAPALKKEDYIHLQLVNPEIEKNIIVPFTVQDSKNGREDQTSKYGLKRLFKKTLEDTNWRLMSDGLSCRLGILSGRLQGYDNEEDLVRLVKQTSCGLSSVFLTRNSK